MPEKCEGHGSQEICEESGKIANEYCPKKKVNTYGAVVPKEKLNLWKTIGSTSTSGKKVTEVCDIHKKPEEKPKENNTTKNNTNTSSKTNSSNKTNKNSTTTPGNKTPSGAGNNQPKNNTNVNKPTTTTTTTTTPRSTTP